LGIIPFSSTREAVKYCFRARRIQLKQQAELRWSSRLRRSVKVASCIQGYPAIGK
jgi:hypothetical protein